MMIQYQVNSDKWLFTPYITITIDYHVFILILYS